MRTLWNNSGLRLASIMIGVGLVGCSGVRALRHQVAEDFQCQPDEVEDVVTDYGRGWATVEGVRVAYTQRGETWTACTGPGTYDELRERAGFDLSCPADELTLRSLSPDGGNQGVTGCNKKAAYVLRGCAEWILNSDASE